MPRGNPSKLQPPKTKQEASERGRNGGIKSGEVRRQKRTMREAAQMLLSLKPTEQVGKNLEQLGIAKNEQTNQMGVLARVLISALSGDIDAAKFLRDTIGEAPMQNFLQMNQVNETTVEESKVNVYALELPDNGRDKPKPTPKKRAPKKKE